jgi:hypothetical protein
VTTVASAALSSGPEYAWPPEREDKGRGRRASHHKPMRPPTNTHPTGPTAVLRGHGGDVQAVAFSPHRPGLLYSG